MKAEAKLWPTGTRVKVRDEVRASLAEEYVDLPESPEALYPALAADGEEEG